MRTYTSMTAGTSAKLLVTTAGTTRTVATVPDPATAAALATEMTQLARQLLQDAARPGFPEALRTLGVRQIEVQPEPGHLRISPLAQQPAPDLTPGRGAWRSTGYNTVRHLAGVLHQVGQLPEGPQRSLRVELADLLSAADGLVVTATVNSDSEYRDDRITLNITGWMAAATDDELEAVIGDDFEPGYGTDQIAWDLEDLTAPVMGGGFSVRVDADQALAWLRAHRPHLLAEQDTPS